MNPENEHVVAPSLIALGMLKERIAADAELNNELQEAFLKDLAAVEPHLLTNLRNHVFGTGNEASEDNNQ